MIPSRAPAITSRLNSSLCLSASSARVRSVMSRNGGLDPTVVVGALWDHLGSNAVLGRGGYFVAEADESDGSFAYLSPQITVVTNLDREHLDHYRDLAHIQETFAAYFQKLPPEAKLVAWADDPNLAPLLRRFSGGLTTYSLSPGADFRATKPEPQGLGCRFRLWYRGRELGRIAVPLAGSQYVLNAMAACAVGHNLGLDFSVWGQGLKGLGQIQRRCQVKGLARGVLVLDDYGHHPTEIAATLKGLAQAFPQRRLVVAFQPHRYSRTAALWRSSSRYLPEPGWCSSPKFTRQASPPGKASRAGPFMKESAAAAMPRRTLWQKRAR